MKFLMTDESKIRGANIIVFTAMLLFIFFDKTILGVGIAFTISGLLSTLAFALNLEPLWMSIDTQTTFEWFFERYSRKALNLVYGLISLIIGIAALITEFR
jgi:hypothetical protein